MIDTYKDLLSSDNNESKEKIQRNRSGKRKFLDKSFENSLAVNYYDDDNDDDYARIRVQLQETNSFFGMTNINRPFTLVKREIIVNETEEEEEEFDNYRELTKLDFKYEPRSYVEREFKYVNSDFNESQLIDNSLSSSSLESYPTLVKNEFFIKEELEEFENYRELTKLDLKYEPRVNVQNIENSLSSNSLETFQGNFFFFFE